MTRLLETTDDDVAVTASEPPRSLRGLLERLDGDARLTLEIGLGESLRVGQRWLGVEFLLMGLTKHPPDLLPRFLAKIGDDPSIVRGAWRGLVPVLDKDWRLRRNVKEVGARAMRILETVDPAQLQQLWATDQPRGVVVTPRLMALLADAADLAGNELIGPDHLLLASLRHHRSRAVSFLIGVVELDAGRKIQELILWAHSWRGGSIPEGNPPTVIDRASPEPEPESRESVILPSDVPPPLPDTESRQSVILPSDVPPPHPDTETGRNQAVLAPLVAMLTGELKRRGIELLVLPDIEEKLCSPAWWLQCRRGMATADAFKQLVSEPLTRRVSMGEFGIGDHVEVFWNVESDPEEPEIDFRRTRYEA